MTSKENNTRTQILDATWKLMEQHRGRGVRMTDIAKAAGISRQAVYLHFRSRTELMVETTHYVDELKGLGERIERFHMTTGGIARLVACIEIWANYIPEIYPLAKALLMTRDSDEASAEAWDDRMSALRSICENVIIALEQDDKLSPSWSKSEAIDMLWTILSIQNWEQLTIECGWSTEQYISWMKILLIRTLVDKSRPRN